MQHSWVKCEAGKKVAKSSFSQYLCNHIMWCCSLRCDIVFYDHILWPSRPFSVEWSSLGCNKDVFECDVSDILVLAVNLPTVFFHPVEKSWGGETNHTRWRRPAACGRWEEEMDGLFTRSEPCLWTADSNRAGLVNPRENITPPANIHHFAQHQHAISC